MRQSRTANQVVHQHCRVGEIYRVGQHRIQMPLSKTSINVLRVVAVLGFVAVLLVATLVFHVQDHIGELTQWIQDNKVIGSVSFVALYALFTGEGCMHGAPLLTWDIPCVRLRARSCALAVLPVPAAVMSLAAGAIFGLLLGSLLVFSGAVIGEIGCFIVGRCAGHDLNTAVAAFCMHP